LHKDSAITQHVSRHGDGVKVLGLWVDDAQYSFDETTKRGASSEMEPITIRDEFGEVTLASIKTYGDTVHTFVDRKNYKGPFLPGYKPAKNKGEVKPIGLKYVDHCVGNVELGQMNKWVNFYERVMGFNLLVTFDDKDISTDYSALMSKVVSSGNGFIKFPINEPAEGNSGREVSSFFMCQKYIMTMYLTGLAKSMKSSRHSAI